MKRKHNIPPGGFKFADTFGVDDIEWDDEAAVREAREARAEAHKLRSRMQQCFSPKRLASLARDRWWLKRYAALEKWEKQTAKEEAATEQFLQNVRAVMHLELEQAWLKQRLAEAEERGRELTRELNRDIVRQEKKELLRRGVVRGRRK